MPWPPCRPTYLPAADAVGVFAVLDEHARHAGSPADERSMDARRADALVLHPTGYRSQHTNATEEPFGADSTPGSTASATGDRGSTSGGDWRRHHQIKQSPGWSVTHHPGGCTTWTRAPDPNEPPPF